MANKKQSNKLVLVTGATGHQGGAALRILREKGYPVRALTRHPDRSAAHSIVGHGTEIVRGDLKDMPSLMRAMDGVYGIFGVLTHAEDGAESEIGQGMNLVDAAKRSRISHFVYSSVAGADRKTGIPHFESKFQIEERLRSSGLPYTMLRPVFFMENWLNMRDGIERGGLRLPLKPDTRLQMVAVRDIGTAAAMSVERPGHWQGRAVELAGDELSMQEIANALGRLGGHEVPYVQISWEEFEQTAGHEMTLMWRWFENVGFSVAVPELRREIPTLMNFERWLQSHWRPKVQTA